MPIRVHCNLDTAMARFLLNVFGMGALSDKQRNICMSQVMELVIQAVLMAVWQRSGRTPVILHSDRGCQFTSDEYQAFLAAHHITCSMSAMGGCADNAAAESFFGVLKRERVNRRQYRTKAEARADIFDYIERWHNPRQRRRLTVQQQGKNS